MVAGFAEEGGQHSGFRTNNKKMVNKFLEIYVEGKIIAEALHHKNDVLSGRQVCPCLEFLQLLEAASQEARYSEQSSPLTPTKGTKRTKGRK
jgi:hypothetical protein